jgi:hypothetical protein
MQDVVASIVESLLYSDQGLTAENAALISRVEQLERDLDTRDGIVTRYTARLERLTTKNTELERSLENSFREIERGQKSLEDCLTKHSCVICTSAEADRLTGCVVEVLNMISLDRTSNISIFVRCRHFHA